MQSLDLGQLKNHDYLLAVICELQKCIIERDTQLKIALQFMKIIYDPEKHGESVGVFIEFISKELL